jgi:hypothetical protein
MEDLLGTCGDDCAQACRAAEAYRGDGSSLAITLIVLLLLFLAMDAMIACVAIYRAGHPSARPGTRTGAAVQSSSGPRSGARALGGSGT